jgi:hypothetical protein
VPIATGSINQKTVAKGKKRAKRPMCRPVRNQKLPGPLHSGGGWSCRSRCHTLLPLDDSLYVLHPKIGRLIPFVIASLSAAASDWAVADIEGNEEPKKEL